jgi:hypothetical protein
MPDIKPPSPSMAEDPTWNEAYLMRLFNFKSLKELCLFLSQPDNPASLNTFDPPDEFYEEIAKAEEEREFVEALEQLWALPSPDHND